jgi:hypothetical protein
VWQGTHRLTTKDYFAAANARNTALCHAPDGWIVFADDQAVLMPDWYSRVRAAIEGNYIVFGAYKKASFMNVVNGELLGSDIKQSGIDSRWGIGSADKAVPASPTLLYGASFALPVSAMLRVNGMDEKCDPVGGEDYNLGIRLGNSGWKDFRYDRRMLTIESEDLAGAEPAFVRVDKGVSPNDASHALLEMSSKSSRAANSHLGMSMEELRQQILAGHEFPIVREPAHDFFDNQPLCEM